MMPYVESKGVYDPPLAAILSIIMRIMLRRNSCGLGAGSLCFHAHSPFSGCAGTKPRPSIPTAMECSYEHKCSSNVGKAESCSLY